MNKSSAYYGDYGVFIGYFDDAQSLHKKHPHSSSVRDRFTECCTALKTRIHADSSTPRLFEPTFATAFGHYDELAFALIDDLADFAQLTSWLPELESYTLSLCPRVEALLAGRHSAYFVNAREFLGESLLDASTSGGALTPPLLSVTHLKLNGFGTMRYGIEMQAAAAELIIEKVETVMNWCLADSTVLEMPKGTISEDDFAITRCCILEPQSSDDLTLMVRTSNYSVIGCIIAAIRSLTASSLILASNDGSPGKTYRRRLAQRGSIDPVKSRSEPDLSRFRIFDEATPHSATSASEFVVPPHSPLFVSSYTTLGAFAKVTELDGLKSRVRGQVSVYGVADTTPGHDYAIARCLIDARPKNDQLLSAPSTEDANAVYRFLHPGHHDVAYSYIPTGFKLREQLVDTTKLFDAVTRLFAEDAAEGGWEGFSDLTQEMASGVLDLSTHLAIPIHRMRTSETTNLQPLVSLFGSGPPPSPLSTSVAFANNLKELSEWLRVDLGLHNPRAFEAILRNKLRLPDSACAVALRSSNDFLTAIADPLRCDDVFDLVESFGAFSAFVHDVAAIPVSDSAADWNASRRRLRLFAVEYVSDLSSALQARIGRATPRHDGYFARDDVRGSLGDLFSSSEAVLKCCAGALRVALFGLKAAHSPRMRNRVGAVMSAQLNQRTLARISSHPATHNYMLAMNTDVANLFQINNLIGIVHEFGHLLYLSLICQTSDVLAHQLYSYRSNAPNAPKAGAAHYMPSPVPSLIQSSEVAKELEDWVSELCADFLVRVFVFGEDEQNFIACMIDSFRTRVAELDDDQVWEGDAATIALAGQYRRIVHVCNIWNSCQRVPPSSPADAEELARQLFDIYRPPSGTVGSDWSDFLEFFRMIDRSFKLDDEVLKKLIGDPIVALYRELFPCVSDSGEKDIEGWAGECVTDVLNAHSIGTPYPLYYENELPWDESQLVFAVLRASASISRQPRVRPSSDGPSPTPSSGNDPNKRAQRFLEHACHYKTLWHVSARQRCRRLIEAHQLLRDTAARNCSQ